MKPLNVSKRAALSRDMAMKEEALAILEGMRQEASAGAYDPALAERNKRLIMGTIDDTPVAPYNTVRGNQIKGLGIAGKFQPDSDVRRHTVYADTGDPLLDREVAQYGLKALGINTEYLSPERAQSMYEEWAALQRANSYTRNQDDIGNFNRSLGEYYGQQALKLMGARAVDPRDRSKAVRMDNGRSPNSTLNTNRLIETNKSLLGGDVGRPAGDYRYYTPDGQVRVGDYQVGIFDQTPNDAEIRLQMMKGSAMPRTLREGFVSNLRENAQGVQDIDEALWKMRQKGLLPDLVVGEIKQNKAKPGEKGMRAGKMLSDAWFMGQKNRDDQYRYKHVLFGINDGRELATMPGALPKTFIDIDAATARQYMAETAPTADIRISNMGRNADGSAYFLNSTKDLLNAGVAVNLPDKYPTVNQLL